MNQEKIIQAITTYLKNADWNWRLPVSASDEKIAAEIATAIAPHLEAGAEPKVIKDFQVGAHVKIVSRIETGDRFSHHFQIGHLGTITRVDPSDPLYQYLIDDHDFGWVVADEIELIG